MLRVQDTELEKHENTSHLLDIPIQSKLPLTRSKFAVLAAYLVQLLDAGRY